MNDDKPQEIDAQQSKCWICKHGLCVKESETERVYHANMRGMPPSPDGESFGIFEEMPFQEGGNEDDSEEIIEHTIEHERIKTICYWRPTGIENSPPILVAKVQQCSRFEQRLFIDKTP